MIVDSGEDVRQIGLRIEAIHLGGLNDSHGAREWLGASVGPGDVRLVVEFVDMAQMDRAFAHLEEGDHDALRSYTQMHGMIDRAEVGLYRPYPDPVAVERLSLI